MQGLAPAMRVQVSQKRIQDRRGESSGVHRDVGDAAAAKNKSAGGDSIAWVFCQAIVRWMGVNSLYCFGLVDKMGAG
jgi:hypothetical protein